jgi:hypothetical protein
MQVLCVEHAGDEGLGLGCMDGSSELEVGADRGGWDNEAAAGRLAGGRDRGGRRQKKGGVDRGPQR